MPSSILNSDDGVISGTSGLKSSGGDDGVLQLQSNGADRLALKASEVVVNDGGANVDFRVEGDTNANLLFVDASTDRVGVGTSSPAAAFHVNNTGAMIIPVGTTAERPASPAVGMIRQNTDTDVVETYDGVQWIAVGSQSAPYSVEYLVIAGGAGGGYGGGNGAGGGAGGYRSSVTGESSGGGASAESPLTVTPLTAYTVTVGGGGAGATTNTVQGTNGSNSVFGSITSTGGGGGAGDDNNSARNGLSGGSGGGGGGGGGANPAALPQGGAGTTGQGYAGGSITVGSTGIGGCGGGGAGAVGSNVSGVNGGSGGTGVSSSITGSAVTRGGGGGGAAEGGGSQGTGGAGGGGNGSAGSPTQGGTNTGGGGGGNGIGAAGAAGGSGIVIIRYFGSQRGTGGTVTSSGGYTIHTFTSSGTYTA